MILLNFHSEYS